MLTSISDVVFILKCSSYITSISVVITLPETELLAVARLIVLGMTIDYEGSNHRVPIP